ncbi:MAG: flagellar hook-associated protein FlgK [Alphaproteobacteria bacterium]|nr:flagellar hook-associated protein FlgK [Alphaproteobacteria bacterium]
MPAVNPLNVALSGLTAAQAQIAVTSNNVANVSTPGYSRKSVDLYSNVIEGEGSGVKLGIVQRRIDEILLRDLRTQVSLSTQLQTRDRYLGQIQDFHGPPDSNQSITAYVGNLKDSFAELANQPESTYLLNTVYNKAQQLVDKFSAFSAKLTSMRNSAQAEMTVSVSKINALTTQISDLNASIKLAMATDESTAELDDQLDVAIKSLSEEVDITYYKANGVTVVQTRQGQLLVDTKPVEVYFEASALGPTSYYPTSAGSVRLGNPTTGVDLTLDPKLGGNLGELIKMRDETLPTYQAQLDELAHKMAMRFSAEGLDLFTLPDGTIPANTPSSYVGFSADMIINPDVTNDITLIRKGTSTGSTIQSGSSELLRKIVEYTFGSTEYMRARGTVDISNTVPTLFTTLGIAGQARLVGTTDITDLGSLDTSPYINPPAEDDFTIQVGAAAAQTITITSGMLASGLVTAINTAYPGMAQLGNGGELVLTANNTITIGAGSLGAAGLAELGLTAGATSATPPTFTVAAGKNTPTTIQIASTDTSTTLLSKLNAVPGITATLATGGFLNIEPTDGGDIYLVDGISSPLTALGISITNVAHTAFNTSSLGPGSSLDGEVTGAITLQNYVTQAISLQSRYANSTSSELTSAESYKAVIETEYLDKTGVNVDEEMAKLINVQTAYNASARTIKIAQELLDDLFAILG